MESTGPYWLALAHWLQAQPGVTVVLVNPAHVKRGQSLFLHTMAQTSPLPIETLLQQRLSHGFLIDWIVTNTIELATELH